MAQDSWQREFEVESHPAPHLVLTAPAFWDVPPEFPYRAPEALVHQRVELRFDRDHVWIEHRGQTVARYARSYEPGSWQPAPRMRPEPPVIAPVVAINSAQIVVPALSDYAELCA